MSKRAEEAALKAYPDYRSWDGGYVTQRKPRTYYIKGYEQAEKDTIERAAEWLSSIENGDKIVDVKAFVEAFKNEMEEE